MALHFNVNYRLPYWVVTYSEASLVWCSAAPVVLTATDEQWTAGRTNRKHDYYWRRLKMSTNIIQFSCSRLYIAVMRNYLPHLTVTYCCQLAKTPVALYAQLFEISGEQYAGGFSVINRSGNPWSTTALCHPIPDSWHAVAVINTQWRGDVLRGWPMRIAA